MPGYAASDAKPHKASDWLGHAVTTRDGKELGTVRDFAIDEHGKVIYLVVSVGSFLIENNLIAVAPDALAPSRANDNVLELAADPDALVKAQRFASDSRWPTKPDVLRGDAHAIAASGGAADTQPATVAPASTGSQRCHQLGNQLVNRVAVRQRNDREPLEDRSPVGRRALHQKRRPAPRSPGLTQISARLSAKTGSLGTDHEVRSTGR